MKTPEHTPISPEEKETIAESFYKDSKRAFENHAEEKDSKKKRWDYQFLYLEEARDKGPFDMARQVGLRHTDHIDDSLSVLSAALKLAKADTDPPEEHMGSSLVSQLRRRTELIKFESQSRERKNLPPTAEPKSKDQEIKDAIGRMAQEIQTNIQEHDKASYVTEKTPDDPTATTNREIDYQPENRLKLSRILLGTSEKLGRATLRDPSNKDKYQEVRIELQNVVLNNVLDVMETNEETPSLMKRIFQRR
jgi:hypothetical protein